jgi:hypothetical protein
MRGCLDRIARMLVHVSLDDLAIIGEGKNWGCLRHEHTIWIRRHIAEMSWKPAYQNQHLSALRGVLKAAWN